MKSYPRNVYTTRNEIEAQAKLAPETYDINLYKMYFKPLNPLDPEVKNDTSIEENMNRERSQILKLLEEVASNPREEELTPIMFANRYEIMDPSRLGPEKACTCKRCVHKCNTSRKDVCHNCKHCPTHGANNNDLAQCGECAIWEVPELYRTPPAGELGYFFFYCRDEEQRNAQIARRYTDSIPRIWEMPYVKIGTTRLGRLTDPWKDIRKAQIGTTSETMEVDSSYRSLENGHTSINSASSENLPTTGGQQHQQQQRNQVTTIANVNTVYATIRRITCILQYMVAVVARLFREVRNTTESIGHEMNEMV